MDYKYIEWNGKKGRRRLNLTLLNEVIIDALYYVTIGSLALLGYVKVVELCLR